MRKPRIPLWVHTLIARAQGHAYYPWVLALIAFASTTTFAFPFVIVLIPGVLIAPRAWLRIGLLTGLCSGIGGALLVGIFHVLGSELILAHYPQLLQKIDWHAVSAWLDAYGLLALAFIAGSPIPQTPALFLYSLAHPSFLGAGIAIGLGKTVKYVFLAWLTARYPARFMIYKSYLEKDPPLQEPPLQDAPPKTPPS